MTVLSQWTNDILVWIGFGTVVGLLAKALMPGPDGGGTIATLAMGIGGTVLGCGSLMLLTEGQRITPISIVGFLVSTGGAFTLLLFAKIFNTRQRHMLDLEAQLTGKPRTTTTRRRRRKAGASTLFFDE